MILNWILCRRWKLMCLIRDSVVVNLIFGCCLFRIRSLIFWVKIEVSPIEHLYLVYTHLLITMMMIPHRLLIDGLMDWSQSHPNPIDLGSFHAWSMKVQKKLKFVFRYLGAEYTVFGWCCAYSTALTQIQLYFHLSIHILWTLLWIWRIEASGHKSTPQHKCHNTKKIVIFIPKERLFKRN